MRILVTKLGDEYVKLMTEENLTLTKFNQTQIKTLNNTRNSTAFKTLDNQIKTPIGTKSPLKKSINNKMSLSISKREFQVDIDSKAKNTDSAELISSKVISIKQKKLNIPKNLTERYNSDNNASLILPSVSLPKFKESASTNNNNNSNNFSNINITNSMNTARTGFTFKDILEETTYRDLKRKLVFDKKMKDRLSRIDESKFRSTYGEKSNVEKLDEMLTCNINPDKINLINYLNKKKDISNVLIKKISEYSEDKTNKANKMCQIVFFNEENQHLFKDRINGRILAKKNREITEYKTSIEEMGENLKYYGNILKDYERKGDKKEIYRDIHNDIVSKFWNKYKVSRYERRSSKDKSHSNVDDLYNPNSPLKKKSN